MEKLNRLAELIDNEIELQKELFKVSQKMTQNLIKGNYQAISDLSSKSESIMTKIRKIEDVTEKVINERSANSVDELVNKNQPGDDPIKKFNKDINKKLNKMTDIISKITASNYRNALLIKQAMDVQSYEMKLLTEKLSDNVVYGNKGKLGSTNDNLFMDQQI